MNIVEAKFIEKVRHRDIDFTSLYDLLDACNKTFPLEDESHEVVIKPGANPSLFYTFVKPMRAFSYGQFTFSYLLDTLSIHSIAEIFKSMLRERRILFYSKNLEILSGCILALVSFIYPFEWQHIFIPILPSKLVNYCCAPMPFIIGIHDSLLETVESLPLEDIVFVDLDKDVVDYDSKIEEDMSKDLIEDFKKGIHNFKVKNRIRGGVHDEEILIFIEKFWNRVLGDYKDFFERTGGKVVFEKEKFLSSSPRNVRRFLGHLCTSQMFDQYVYEQEYLFQQGVDLYSSKGSPHYSKPQSLLVREMMLQKNKKIETPTKPVYVEETPTLNLLDLGAIGTSPNYFEGSSEIMNDLLTLNFN